jgi:hypothetical protein
VRPSVQDVQVAVRGYAIGSIRIHVQARKLICSKRRVGMSPEKESFVSGVILDISVSRLTAGDIETALGTSGRAAAAAEEEVAGDDGAEGVGGTVDPGPEDDKRDAGAEDGANADVGARPAGRPGILGRPRIDLLSLDREAPPKESEYVVGTLACES